MDRNLLRPARIANKKVAHTLHESPEKRGGAEGAEKRRDVSTGTMAERGDRRAAFMPLQRPDQMDRPNSSSASGRSCGEAA
jgi:hypothetical protein